MGLIDRVTQTSNAQFQQLQQGMMAMFGIVSQLVSHTGLQIPQLLPQAVATPIATPLVPAVALAQATPPVALTPAIGDFSLSALLGSSGRPLFSPLPAVSLFTDTPTVTAS